MTAKREQAEERNIREKAARIRFVKTVVDFVQSILLERGQILVHTTGFTHTHTIRELLNFGVFSSYTDTGQTMLGGNDVKVWHHPSGQFDKEVSALVLHVWWQIDIEKCEVIQLDPDQQWQREILQIIRSKKTVVAQSTKKARTKYEEEQYQQRLARKMKGEYAL